MCVCVWGGVYTQRHIHTYTNRLILIQTHTYIHTHTHTYIHMCVHTHTYIHKYIDMHTYIHKYICLYTHTHTQTQVFADVFGAQVHIDPNAGPDSAALGAALRARAAMPTSGTGTADGGGSHGGTGCVVVAWPRVEILKSQCLGLILRSNSTGVRG